MLLAVLLVLLAPLPPVAPSDTSEAPLRLAPRFYPTALYTPSSGFGIGLGLRVEPPWPRQSFFLVTAAPAQHTGRYTLTASTHDLDAARDGDPPRLYAALFASYHVNGRQWYYGLGPAAQRADRTQTVLRAAHAEMRAGTYLTPRLMLQPHLGWWRAGLEAASALPDGLDRASRRSLQTALAHDLDGPFAGIRLVYDTRDRLGLPRRGLLAQLEVQRHRTRGRPSVRFDTAQLRLYGYLPLPGRSTLALRMLAAALYDRGDAPVPFYRLPEPGALVPGIADFRFYGRRLLALGAEWRRPVVDLYGLAAVELVGAAHLAGVYDDLGAQFTPRVSLADDFDRDRDRYPLRPILGLGLRLTRPARDRVLVSAMLRYSPFGLGAGSLGFFHDLREMER